VLAPGGDDPNGPTPPSCGHVDDTEILSTYWSGGNSCYATDEGTSMATPFVSGTLALLLGRGLSPQDAVRTMLATLNRSVTCGSGGGCQGLVDAAAAVAATATAANPASPSPGAAPAPASQEPGITAAGSRPGSVSAHGASVATVPGTSSQDAAGRRSAPGGHLWVGRVTRAAAAAHRPGGGGLWAPRLVVLTGALGVAAALVWRRFRSVGRARHAKRSGNGDSTEPTEHPWQVLARR
jgi:subtilisin family serine protease